MNKGLMLIGGFLLVSSVVLAEETVMGEACAGGAGTIVKGAVSNHKYCKSNTPMTWWNAVSWCNGLKDETGGNRRLFSLSDCACSTVTANCAGLKCAEVVGMWKDGQAFTDIPVSAGGVHSVHLSAGNIYTANRANANTYYPLCK